MILAYTGIAASNISGSTIHSVCGFIFNKGNGEAGLAGDTLAEYQERWSKIEYVFLDEISVVGQTLLAQLHKFFRIVKAVNHEAPFAGINMIFSGDFQQLPPVQDTALYMPSKINQVDNKTTEPTREKKSRRGPHLDSAVAKTIGRELWQSVQKVVELKQPMRQIADPTYASILSNIRKGYLPENQRQILRTRILGDDRIATDEWKRSVFLVTRNQLRARLNFEATREYADDQRQLIVYSCARDTYNGNPIEGSTRRRFLSVSDTKENSLCGILPLSIGIKVLITTNICANDGLANGSEGILRQIVYEAGTIDYSSSKAESLILKTPPKYAVIELTGRKCGRYEGLPVNHAPIYPTKMKCTYTRRRRDGSKISYQFQRTQLPLTPGFAFTDYKCQGRTLEKTVVDLAEGATSTGIYVMLSRVQKLEDLLILRPFKESALDIKISTALREELKRLEDCAKETEKLERWPCENGSA